MTGLRARTLVLGAALVAVAIPTDLWAQAGPPVRLTPPSAEPAPAPSTEPVSPAQSPSSANQTGSGASTIEVSQPAPINTGAVGLAEPASLNLPTSLWEGTSRATIERLLAGVPAANVSRPARELTRRLLVVAAPPPAEAAGNEKRPSYIGVRAAKLMAMGDVEAATGLARLVPSRAEDEALARVQLDAAFEAFDNAGACTQARGHIARFGDEYWQKALVFCQALANEFGFAQLGLSLMREQKMADDPALTRLVASMAGDTRSTVEQLPAPTPLHLAMMRAARQSLPADLGNSTDPLILRMIAASPNATSDLRLVAAERAEAYGALSAEALAPLYDSFTFTPEQLSNALTIAQEDRGPRGRAAVHRAVRAQPAGVPRAELLQRSWRLARERGGYATAVRVDLPALLEIAPAPDLMFFAVEATRALLLAGKTDEARRWYALVRAGAPGNELASTADALLWPLMWLAHADERNAGGTSTTNRLTAWRQAQERLDSSGFPRRAALLAVLLIGSGARADAGMINGLIDGATARETAPMPPVGLTLGLSTATEGKRTGEAALYALNILSPEGAAATAPHALVLVLDGLRAVGLEADARAIAVETAIAAGL